MVMTIRQQLSTLLGAGPCTARELSQQLRISEKQVTQHLEHIARSAAGRGRRLKILPIHCLDCGYGFSDRKRFTPPSRCPRCKQSHLEEVRYAIV